MAIAILAITIGAIVAVAVLVDAHFDRRAGKALADEAAETLNSLRG